MKPLYLFGLLAVFIFSCHSRQASKAKQVIKDTPKQLVVNDLSQETDTLPITADSSKRICGYSVRHLFSDTAHKDEFSLTMYGGQKDSVMVFKILNYKRKELFKYQFFAADLLGDMTDVLSSKQASDTIKTRMADFFNEARFTIPAIDKTGKIDDDFEEPNTTDIDNWDDIKSDKEAVCFYYHEGYESTIGIAYSKKKQKVVIISAMD